MDATTDKSRESVSQGGVNQQAPVNPVSRKVSKILDNKIDTDRDTLRALQTLSSFMKENSQQARRNLRRDIEQRSLTINRQFLEHFKEVKINFDDIVTDISAMGTLCNDMNKRLQNTKEQTRDLINKTTRLQTESKSLLVREEIANAFLAAFQLKLNECKALKVNIDGGITAEFFPALVRVKKIQESCKVLLRSNQTKAGLEIMELMLTYQEAAYENLYRWVQRETRVMNVDTTELNALLCEAMKAMQDRPVLFMYSINEFTSARRNNIVRSFIDALTRGGPGGVPKPIELLSHDTMRYVGDMSAWIYQALASEKELLVLLLKYCDVSVSTENIPPALCHITEGLCRPYKVRVEQVLTGDNGPVVLYRLSNLFIFYHGKISSVLGLEAAFVQALSELRELTTNLFCSSLNTNVARLLEKVQPPGSELLPVQALHQVLLLLRDVLESHDSAVITVENKQQNYSKIFACVIDPLIQSLIISASELDALDAAAYMMNCLYALFSTLSLYEYSDRRLEMLQAQIDAQCDVLVSEQAGYILKRTCMSALYNTVIQHHGSQGPLSSLPDADAVSIKSGLDKFDLFLGSPDSYRLPQFKLINSPKIRGVIHERTMDVLCTAYGQIYKKLHDPVEKYTEPDKIMPKTVEAVKSLLK